MRQRGGRTQRDPRPDWRSLHERRPAAGSANRGGRARPARSHVDRGRRWRRALALVLALAELALLGFLVLGPYFRIQQVDVQGTRHLGRGQVAARANAGSGSIFAVDPTAIAGRVDGSSPWIRTARVGTRLPHQVTVRVEEWQPVATYQPGGGRPWYLSDQAVALGPAASGSPSQSRLVQLQGPATTSIRRGRHVLDARLLVALVNIQRALPDIIGQDVQFFQLDSCGNLTMVAGGGWKAQFGRVLTPEELASLQQKVAALKAVSARVDFNNPDLDYVNVMNPAQVAVMDKSAEKSRAPSPRPVAGASPSAVIGPSPSAPQCS